MVEREDSVPLCGTDPGLASATKFAETPTPGGLPRLAGKQRLLLQESRFEELEEHVRVTLRSSLDKHAFDRVAPACYELERCRIHHVQSVVQQPDVNHRQQTLQLYAQRVMIQSATCQPLVCVLLTRTGTPVHFNKIV